MARSRRSRAPTRWSTAPSSRPTCTRKASAEPIQRSAVKTAAAVHGQLHLDPLVAWIVERPKGYPRIVGPVADLHRPLARIKECLIDRLTAGLDHGQSDRTAESPAVRGGAYVAKRFPVPTDDLGVEHERLRIGEQYLHQALGERAGGLLR